MKDLSRHIEYLLCTEESVVLPDFGKFTVSYLPASYLAEECRYIPPVRTVRLNTRSKQDDHQLENCLVSLHSVSHNVARKWIQEFVEELNTSLVENSQIDFGTTGTIVRHNNHIRFDSCLAGIDSPELYGLDSFHMEKLPQSMQGLVTTTDNTRLTISFKRKTLERISGIAAVLVIVLSILLPTYDTIANNPHYARFFTTEYIAKYFSTNNNTVTAKATKTVKAANTVKPITIQATTTAKPIVTQKQEPVKEAVSTDPHGYCIVMASGVTEKGATALVSKLKSEGHDNAIVYHDRTMIRVLLIGYSDKANIQNEIRTVRQSDTMYSDCWIKYYN